MAKFTLNITCDNAAFEEDMTQEIGDILQKIATEVILHGMEDVDFWQTIRDSNGNDVGRYRLAINRQD